MSKGVGREQRAILDALRTEQACGLTTAQLAERTGRSPRQVRTAVDSLERRGLVVVTRQYTGWRGGDEYGAWEHARDNDRDREKHPNALHVAKGEPIPGRPGWCATRDLLYWHIGMPVYGRVVWLPERKTEYDRKRKLFIAKAIRSAGG